jgi:hypothetical protein
MYTLYQLMYAVGTGVPSFATATVVAREGAAAAYTTANGPALVHGMAGFVYEEQTITALAGAAGFVTFALGTPVAAPYSNSISVDTGTAVATPAQVIAALQPLVGAVDVTRTGTGTGPYIWTVTFLDRTGDVPQLTPTVVSASVSTSEFIKGQGNHFSISPRKLSGAAVTDVTSASAFGAAAIGSYNMQGDDVFFTELYRVVNGTKQWESDSGTAAYVPPQLDVQKITIGSTATSGNLCLSFTGYDGKVITTNPCVAYNDPQVALKLKQALDTAAAAVALGANPQLVVDVSYAVVGGNYEYTVWFTNVYGDLPLLSVVGSTVAPVTPVVSKVQAGSTEIQAVTLKGATPTVYEVQSLKIDTSTGSTAGSYTITYKGLTPNPTATVLYSVNAAGLKAALEGMPGIQSVQVTAVNANMMEVKFLDPAGDVPALVITPGAGGSPVYVTEEQKGSLSATGTFVLSYRGQYTDDLPAGASVAEVTQALEALSTLTAVSVSRVEIGVGYTW